MRAIILSVFVLAAALCGMTGQAHAQRQLMAQTSETNFVVTVKAKDSKFIGTAAGGARVIIRDQRTGDIIANGITAGGTGDTDAVVNPGGGPADLRRLLRRRGSPAVGLDGHHHSPRSQKLGPTGSVKSLRATR